MNNVVQFPDRRRERAEVEFNAMVHAWAWRAWIIGWALWGMFWHF